MIYIQRPSGNCFVYLLVLPNHKAYVGYCTGAPENRWRNGKNYGHNSALQEDIEKFGWENVKKYILIANTSADMALCFERHFVSRFDCQYPKGYNMDGGGRRGYTRCQATKDKISAVMTKRYGVPVVQLDIKTGAYIGTFASYSEAHRKTGVNRGDLCSHIHGFRKSAGDYHWKRLSEYQAAGEIPAAFSAFKEDSPCMT